MRRKSFRNEIVCHIEKLPYFTIENLKIFEISLYYLKIMLSRMEKRGEVIRLKKGVYTSKAFIEKTKKDGVFSDFLEFLATKIYAPAYLSLEYILYENNILTEVPQNFTLITRNKTYALKNELGTFFYHKIKDVLFSGYRIEEAGDFLIYKANKAKALFDFLYLRKRMIFKKEMAEGLRLNLDNLNRQDREMSKKYIELEGSKRMKEIYTFLFKDA